MEDLPDDDSGAHGQTVDVLTIVYQHTDATVGQGNADTIIVYGMVLIVQYGVESMTTVEDGNMAGVVVVKVPTTGALVNSEGACGGGGVVGTGGAGHGLNDLPVPLGALEYDDLLGIAADPDQIFGCTIVALGIDPAFLGGIGVV